MIEPDTFFLFFQIIVIAGLAFSPLFPAGLELASVFLLTSTLPLVCFQYTRVRAHAYTTSHVKIIYLRMYNKLLEEEKTFSR